LFWRRLARWQAYRRGRHRLCAHQGHAWAHDRRRDPRRALRRGQGIVELRCSRSRPPVAAGHSDGGTARQHHRARGRGGGQRRDYYLYPPANFNPHGHKKYPLVIGNTLFVNGDPLYQERPHGPLWVQALANGGAFVVVVDRQIWSVGIEQWAENVMPMYRGIIQNPAVDRDRVFLFASSGESQYLSQLLATNSGPWKGIMLLNPGNLPDLDHLPYSQPIPKILISLF